MKQVTDVTFLIYRGGQFLIQVRTDDAPRHPGTRCFPGGAVEEGEKPEAAVSREIGEEYKLYFDKSDCMYFFTYEHDYTPGRDPIVDAVYFVRLSDGQEPLLQEGKAMEWRKLEEIRTFKLGFEQERIISAIEVLLSTSFNLESH